jgi:hypothetical protein
MFMFVNMVRVCFCWKRTTKFCPVMLEDMLKVCLLVTLSLLEKFYFCQFERLQLPLAFAQPSPVQKRQLFEPTCFVCAADGAELLMH